MPNATIGFMEHVDVAQAWVLNLGQSDAIAFAGVVVETISAVQGFKFFNKKKISESALAPVSVPVIVQVPEREDPDKLSRKIFEKLCAKDDELCKAQQTLRTREDEIKDLKDIIEDLRKPRETEEETNLAAKAEMELAKGNVEAAKGFYAEEAKKNLNTIDENKLEAAKNYRRIGALDYMTNPKEAVKSYQKSIELDPSSADGWNQLGLLNRLLGNLKFAEDAFNEVLRLSDSDKSFKAIAYGNLGLIRHTQGDLEGAEDFHLKALEIDKELGCKEGIAAAYGNLGLIRKTQGDLEEAEEFHLKALEIDEELGRKEGMAIRYGNLGNIRKTQGNLEAAKDYWQKALTLFSQIGATREIKKTQALLDELEANKDS
ncbi:tetratricopeptide repeat protein [Maridesulfovibrio sp.]|uniref:tetratricopeptide repeat protein n=1 Tax=unclassified Maridesulfovibrio TaxID=2794999 RepID=UPI003B005B78